ncbi:hypothetical protein GYMLUDRAFT_822979 [Collybiopsis luxurians FD-317 M1]|uniref:Unplaced genomic scaffold GYMLUscaffold_51, whole genome shotgun sequence n=1 Tax=Collybiopsis luxurians FD-317 M1 TaxID=944289 RepID=A0A0D0CDZ8_9AGAR|nr:hypothetical protein GYMLUDRAFT_822979 [Collybiopsis luxurians FD-317 M1]
MLYYILFYIGFWSENLTRCATFPMLPTGITSLVYPCYGYQWSTECLACAVGP